MPHPFFFLSIFTRGHRIECVFPLPFDRVWNPPFSAALPVVTVSSVYSLMYGWGRIQQSPHHSHSMHICHCKGGQTSLKPTSYLRWHLILLLGRSPLLAVVHVTAFNVNTAYKKQLFINWIGSNCIVVMAATKVYRAMTENSLTERV